MNSLQGNITGIEVKGNMSLVTINVANVNFKSIVIETPKTVDYLIEGGEILVLFKETEVIIGLDPEMKISLRNKMIGRITNLKTGSLLAKLNIETDAGNIVSIITANAVKNLGLKTGLDVVAMVKTNEILLAQC